MSNSSDRETILSRVREALSVQTDAHVRQVSSKPAKGLPVLNNKNESENGRTKFLPPVGDTLEDKIGLFSEISTRLQTDFRVVSSLAEAQSTVRELAEQNHWRQVAFHQNELVRPLVEELGLEFLSTDEGYDATQLEQCDAGITACDALIAQTASVLVTSQSAGGRGLSVLPHHHVAIATSAQMLGSMIEGFQLLSQKYSDRWPSFTSFITGPSRTADVERVLVLGAHGPKKLTVILMTH